MITFSRHFCNIKESKFREIDETLISKVKDTVRIYNSLIRRATKTKIKEISSKLDKNSKWFTLFKDEDFERVVLINRFSFKDFETNKTRFARVFVAFGTKGSAIAQYNQSKNAIVLFYNESNSLTDFELEAAIFHEITHGSQEYKTSSPEYDEESKKISQGKPYNKLIYFSEPKEFDAHLTELAYRINAEFNSLYNALQTAKLPETKIIYKKRIDRFLLELEIFIKTDVKSYLTFKELPLPAFFSTHTDFLEVISKKSILLTKLKQKLANLYTRLTSVFS
jgi:hypothetical protein